MSIFLTPILAALEATTHAEASALSRVATGAGISQQAYGLRHKILETAAWLQDTSVPAWEVHPEVSFTHLLGHPATASKKTWAGTQERRIALAAAGIDLADLGPAGRRAATDDVLDAAVVAWSTRRILRGEPASYPELPEVDAMTGRAVAIWA